MIMPPIISAMMPFEGMPRVSIGMNDACAPALLADSGPATPRMSPLPKRPPAPAIFFSIVYEANDESSAPPPAADKPNR